MYERAFTADAVAEFKQILLDRLLELAREAQTDQLVVPVGLFLVLDRANGGDDTADKIVRRFRFLDLESRQAIDFFFLGWKKSKKSGAALEFDLEAFEAFRDALRGAGVRAFGGNADLVLVDAHLEDRRVRLDFTRALPIDLSVAVAHDRITSAGNFLQGLIEAADQIRSGPHETPEGVVFSISDRLGLAVARKSILDFVLEKWGKVIGAPNLQMLAVRKVGPAVDLAKL